MNKRNKTSGTISLDFSEEFQLDDGNLGITCRVYAEVFIQDPIHNADSDCDYYGWHEINDVKYEVTKMLLWDFEQELYFENNWQGFLASVDTEHKTRVLNELEGLIDEEINKQIEKP